MSKQPGTYATFTSSSAKDYIRHHLDRDIIKQFKREHYPDGKLSYLGLPGVALMDVLSWREFIGYCTAVEANPTAVEDLELNILKNRLEGVVHVVCGDIVELLAIPTDQDHLRWPYQIVNLDFYGGLIYATGDGKSRPRTSRRLEALKSLFSKQGDTAFLLFLTLNLRDKDHGELDELVNQQEEDLRIIDPASVEECFERHRELGHAGLLKIYVPIFLLNHAKQHSLRFVSPILYKGTQQMIHFAVQCVPYRDLAAGHIVTTQQRIEEINKPLLVLHDGGDLRAVDVGRIHLDFE